MDKLLSLSIGGKEITPPKEIPTGGLERGGVGEKLIQNGITYLLIAAILLSVVFTIVAGIKWITAGGDKAKIQSARGTLVYSIIGLIIALSAIIIVNLVTTSLFNFRAIDPNSSGRQATCGLKGMGACKDSNGQSYCTEGTLILTKCL